MKNGLCQPVSCKDKSDHADSWPSYKTSHNWKSESNLNIKFVICIDSFEREATIIHKSGNTCAMLPSNTDRTATSTFQYHVTGNRNSGRQHNMK